jgi:hypothetical protein
MESMMKEIGKVFFCFILLTSILFPQQEDFPKLTGPYLGQIPPGNIPELFASGIISKRGSDEWGLAVNENCTEIFFSRGENDKASIYHLERPSGVWTIPRLAEFSGRYNDSHPVFADEGFKLFFGSKRPCFGSKAVLNLWFIEKKNKEWITSQSLGKPFTNQTVHAASVSSDGNIYATGLVVFEKGDSGYKPQHKLLPDISGSQPAVSPDGSYIVFSHRGKDSFGGNDLYVIFKKNDKTWSTAINLGKDINTKSVESSPTISRDGKFIFFSRNGNIWWVSSKIIEEIKSLK